MKKLAYELGIIGYFLTFILCAFEEIMISVNSYGFDIIASLYLFFSLNIIGLGIFILSIINDKYKRINTSFNLSNKGIAVLYLGITIISIIFLINSSKYNLDATNFKILIKGFIFEPTIYLPILPILISGILFIVSSKEKDNIQKYELKKIKRVSHS